MPTLCVDDHAVRLNSPGHLDAIGGLGRLVPREEIFITEAQLIDLAENALMAHGWLGNTMDEKQSV